MATCLFRSQLAFRLQCFLEARKRAGQRGIASQKILIYLDRFLAGELQPGETITREVAGHWIQSLESLSIGTRINRLSVLRPHVCCALARGVSRARLVIWHILAPSAAPLLALAGISTTLAFGAAIPVEVVCDSPGIGQLAWQAALQRDFPLLVNLSLIVCVLTAGSNVLAEAAAGRIGTEKPGR